MIKLFITDIDGCLLEALKTPELPLIEKIKSLNEQSSSNPLIPPLTICTGRPMPYAEAVAQLIGIRKPLAFENAGIFCPEDYRVSIDKRFTSHAEQQVLALKKWLKEEIIPEFDGMIPEFSKLMDAGLIHPHRKVIDAALPPIQEFVQANYPNFEVNHTGISINIILKSNTKKTGISKLCELQNVKPHEVAYIGDSKGDIVGLEYVGFPFAPQNATREVKKIAEVIPAKATHAVLKVYEQLIKRNKMKGDKPA